MMNGQWKGHIRDIVTTQSRLVVAVLGKKNHPIIFASVYLPDESVKDAEIICDETVAELTRIIRGCSGTYRTPSVVISGGFNVELPGNTCGEFKGIR
eukprot:1685867-Pyramimonas_sp.AAC.1